MQIPGQLPPTSAATPIARKSVEEVSWPFSHATQYVPGDNGAVQPVLKVPFYAPESTMGGVPQKIGEHHALISPDRTMLRVLKSSGELEFCFKSPNHVQQVEYQPQSDTWYVRSDETIHAVSGKDGQEMATISPEKLSCLGKMTVLSNGDLTLVNPLDTFHNGEVVTLKPDLTPRWNRPIDIATKCLLDVGKGHVAVFNDGEELAVLNGSGEEMLRSKNPALYSPIVHDGRLMFIEAKPSKYDAKWKEVVSYDSATGEVRRTKVSREANRIIPLPGGKFMLSDGAAGHPHLSVYGADGERIKRFKFPDDRFMRQMHITEDGKTALAVVGDGDYSLYRLDLEPQKSLWNVIGATANERPEPIFERQGTFTPALLSNGQLAIFHSEGIELDGKKLSSTTEFLQAVGPDVQLATNREATSYISVNERKGRAGPLDKLLCDVQGDFKLPSVRVTTPDKQPYITPDQCLNFPLPALGAMPVAAHFTAADADRVMRSLFKDQATSMTVFDDWKLELGSDKLTLTDAEGKERSSFGTYSHALPLRVGEEKFVAAVGGGDLVWMRPGKYELSKEVYSLGEPIWGLELSPGGRSVLATTANGSRMEFTPPGLTSALQEAGSAPAPQDNTGLHETGSTVQVGGVVIRKRAWVKPEASFLP